MYKLFFYKTNRLAESTFFTGYPVFVNICIIEKLEFLDRYDGFLYKCEDDIRYVWKDQVCDGRVDCLDESDEGNCKSCE